MLQDALRLGEAEGKQALFTEAQLIALWGRVRILPQNRPMDWNGIHVATYTAGHILGAVPIGFATNEGRVPVTGDVSVTPGSVDRRRAHRQRRHVRCCHHRIDDARATQQ